MFNKLLFRNKYQLLFRNKYQLYNAYYNLASNKSAQTGQPHQTSPSLPTSTAQRTPASSLPMRIGFPDNLLGEHPHTHTHTHTHAHTHTRRYFRDPNRFCFFVSMVPEVNESGVFL